MKTILAMWIGDVENPDRASRGLLLSFRHIEVSQGDANGDGTYRQGFQMTLRAERDRKVTKDYALLDDPSLRPGNRLVLSIKLDAVEHPLFDGIIKHRQLLSTGATEPGLLITGEDLTTLMDKVSKDQSHGILGDHEIASKIIKDYAKYGISPRVNPLNPVRTRTENERTIRQNATDRAFLQMLSRQHGFVFYLQPGPSARRSVAYWGKFEQTYPDRKVLTANAGSLTNLESLSFEEDTGKPVQLVGSVHQDDSTDPLKFNIEKSSVGTTLAEKPTLSDNPENVRRERVTYPGIKLDDAKSRAQARTNLSTQDVLKATGRVDTARYGDVLTAPGKVIVRGVGKHYDGEYYVKSVKHDITPGEYKQGFVLTREGVGSKIDKAR